jgi:hypothetical protein
MTRLTIALLGMLLASPLLADEEAAGSGGMQSWENLGLTTVKPE